jgi:hypothetical protein
MKKTRLSKTYNFSLHCVNGLLYDNFDIYTVCCAYIIINGSRHDRMLVGFTTTCQVPFVRRNRNSSYENNV